MNPEQPFFSICIPQYRRIPFLFELFRSLQHQEFRDFEVCVSDDDEKPCAPNSIVDFLASSGLQYSYRKQKKNRRYDGNLRTALQMARGRYCFLMGNDDALCAPDTLGRLAAFLIEHPETDVLLSNYQEYESGEILRRVSRTGYAGRGRTAACGYFRSFSFVSGVVLKNSACRMHRTRKWDGSEMYQMYLGCRILARGGMLAEYESSTVRRGIVIRNLDVDRVDNKVRVESAEKRSFRVRQIPLGRLAALVWDAAELRDQAVLTRSVFRQFYFMPCLYWLFSYKKMGGLKYYLEVAWGLRPALAAEGCSLTWVSAAALRMDYMCLLLVTLLVPTSVFFRLQPWLYKIAKRRI